MDHHLEKIWGALRGLVQNAVNLNSSFVTFETLLDFCVFVPFF